MRMWEQRHLLAPAEIVEGLSTLKMHFKKDVLCYLCTFAESYEPNKTVDSNRTFITLKILSHPGHPYI